MMTMLCRLHKYIRDRFGGLFYLEKKRGRLYVRKHGDNFWYISLIDKRPSNRNIISVKIQKHYSIIELSTEADPDIIDHCKLIYLGQGLFFDPAIQKELTIHVRRILKNRR